jgi:hypothetical protein
MTAYIINTARAISETIDSETIIINLDTGNYYSMNESATLMWQQLSTAQTVDSLVSYYLGMFDASKDMVQIAIKETIDSLVQEQLIIETTDMVTAPQSTTTSKKVFVAPKIEKYDDMQEMLLADPIHDVDESGWPKLK